MFNSQHSRNAYPKVEIRYLKQPTKVQFAGMLLGSGAAADACLFKIWASRFPDGRAKTIYKIWDKKISNSDFIESWNTITGKMATVAMRLAKDILGSRINFRDASIL